MNHYLIVCRSVTYAQYDAHLQRAALACHIMRIPRTGAQRLRLCCAHPGRDLSQALRAIGQINMRPVALFLDDGISYTEVPL